MTGSDFISMIKDLPQGLRTVREGLRVSNFQPLCTMDGHAFGVVLDEKIVDEVPAYQISIFAQDPDGTVSNKGKTFAEFIEGRANEIAQSEIQIPLGYTDTSFKTLCKHATDTLVDVSKLLELLCVSRICCCGLDMIKDDGICCNNCMIGLAETDHKLLIPTLRGTRCMLTDLMISIDPDKSPSMSDRIRLRTKSNYRFEISLGYKTPDLNCIIRSKDARVRRATKAFKELSNGEYVMYFKSMDEHFKGVNNRDMLPKIKEILARIVSL
jgi:hypothetical protein